MQPAQLTAQLNSYLSACQPSYCVIQAVVPKLQLMKVTDSDENIQLLLAFQEKLCSTDLVMVNSYMSPLLAQCFIEVTVLTDR